MLTTKQAAAIAYMTERGIRKAIEYGNLEATKNERGRWRISRFALYDYIASPGFKKPGRKVGSKRT